MLVLRHWEVDGVAYAAGLATELVAERSRGFDEGAYKACQCDFAFNSNRIEGSRLSSDATKLLWEQDRVVEPATREDIQSAANHFRLFDLMLDTLGTPLTADLLKDMHATLLEGTRKGGDALYNAGGFKVVDNYIDSPGAPQVLPAAEAGEAVAELLGDYGDGRHGLDDILDFHVRFELVHPFSDGNGRIGRMVMFRECLVNRIAPFIIRDDMRPFYIRGLREWDVERGFLRDTCLSAQDAFMSSYWRLAESFANAANAEEIRRAAGKQLQNHEAASEDDQA